MNPAGRRNRFVHVNKYQRFIIMATVVPMAVLCVSLVIMLNKLHADALQFILYGTNAQILNFLDSIAFWILMLSWSIFFIATIWIFGLSNHLVGGFERIIRELDDVIQNKKYKMITARKSDILVNDLLTRINKILENYKP